MRPRPAVQSTSANRHSRAKIARTDLAAFRPTREASRRQSRRLAPRVACAFDQSTFADNDSSLVQSLCDSDQPSLAGAKFRPTRRSESATVVVAAGHSVSPCLREKPSRLERTPSDQRGAVTHEASPTSSPQPHAPGLTPTPAFTRSGIIKETPEQRFPGHHNPTIRRVIHSTPIHTRSSVKISPRSQI